MKQGAGTVLVEALAKKGIIKEAAEKFGVEADDINQVYNSGKNVEHNFSVREYKKEINATKQIHARDRLFIILKNEKIGKCNMFYRLFLSPANVLGLNLTRHISSN